MNAIVEIKSVKIHCKKCGWAHKPTVSDIVWEQPTPLPSEFVCLVCGAKNKTPARIMDAWIGWKAGE